MNTCPRSGMCIGYIHFVRTEETKMRIDDIQLTRHYERILCIKNQFDQSSDFVSTT